ncbi:MAG: sodium:calcium antiporter, partial [Planctomycetota bacterium]
SNIANIGLVLGITSLITPVPASTGVRTIAAPLLLGFTAFCVFFLRTRWQMRRWEGAVLVLLYLAVVPLVASHL